MDDLVEQKPKLTTEAPTVTEPARLEPDKVSAEVNANSARTNKVVIRTGRNAIFLALSFFSHTVSQILILSIIGRLAGVENAGLWAYVIAFTDPFAVFMDFGTTRMLVPEIARRRQEADRLLGNALTLGVVLGLPTLAILTIIANLDQLNHTSTTILALFLAGLALLFSTLTLSIRSAFRASDRFDLEAINSIILAMALLGGSFVVLYLKAPFIWFFIVSAFVYMVVLIQSWVLYNRHLGRLRFQYEPGFLFQHIAGKSLTFMFINLLNRAFIRVDIFILGYFHDPTTVGYYGLVTNLFYRLDVVTRLFMVSILPSMSRAYVTQRSRVGRYLNQMLKVQFLAILPLAVGGFLLAPQLIHLLYGSGFEPSVLFFQLLIIVIPLRFINRTFTITLAAMDLQARTVVALAGAVIFNIAVNLWLIPRYAAIGATLTAMASEVVLFFLVYFCLTSVVRRKIQWRAFARLLPSVLIFILLMYIMRDWLLWFSLPLSFVIYVLTLFWVRAFSMAEVEVLSGLMEAVRVLPLSLQRRLTALMLARTHDSNL